MIITIGKMNRSSSPLMSRSKENEMTQQSLAIRAWMVAIKDSLAETSPKGFLLSFAILRRGGCSLLSFQCQLYFTKLICYYTDSVTVPFNVVSSGYSLWGQARIWVGVHTVHWSPCQLFIFNCGDGDVDITQMLRRFYNSGSGH